MVLEIDEKSLAHAIDQIEGIEDGLDDFTDKNSEDSAYQAIEDVVEEDIVNPILNRARELARQHVRTRAKYIEPVVQGWTGDTYVAGLRSDNEVVLSHEFGSGQYTTTGPYKIEPRAGKERLSFRINGRWVEPKFVIHPGVRGKGFMRRAIREHADRTAKRALDEAQQTLEEALR